MPNTPHEVTFCISGVIKGVDSFLVFGGFASLPFTQAFTVPLAFPLKGYELLVRTRIVGL